MNQIGVSRNKIILFHILFWGALFLLFEFSFTINLSGSVQTDKGLTQMTFELNPYRLQISGLLVKIIFFYVNIQVLIPRYFNKSKALKFAVLFTGLLVGCYLTEYIIIKYIYLKNLPEHIAYFEPAYAYYLKKVIPLFYFILSLLSFVYFITISWIINERTKAQLKEEQLQAEIKLFKYQINPHFLFNTLNSLFSIAQHYKSVELETGISKLSGMMRYMLYDSNTPTVSIEKELNYLYDYIEVFKLRMDPDDDFSIKFHVSGDLSDKYIAPLLLIPLVENALKHGVSFKRKSWVNITLTAEGQSLSFLVENSTHEMPNLHAGTGSGIGLANIRKRLHLLYPNQHSFTTIVENNKFSSLLKINHL